MEVVDGPGDAGSFGEEDWGFAVGTAAAGEDGDFGGVADVEGEGWVDAEDFWEKGGLVREKGGGHLRGELTLVETAAEEGEFLDVFSGEGGGCWEGGDFLSEFVEDWGVTEEVEALGGGGWLLGG